jgi:uncharacterized protein
VGRKALRWLTAIGLLGGLIAPVLAASAASPVWVVRGAHGTVYLAGSVHLLPAQDSTLPKAFERAYADSGTLVMELDLGKLDAGDASGWLLEHGTLPPGTTLRAVLGTERYTRLSTAAADLGLSMEVLNSQAPWVVGLELADVAYTHQGFDPEQGVEEQLVRRALNDGKPTAGLETLDEELGGLETLPRDDQLRLIDQTLDELKESREEMREILGAWRSGDAAKLARLLSEEYRSFPALYQPLVTARNQRWLPQIEQLLKSSDNTLVVVGALHLVGEGGLLELLKKDGYDPIQLN